GRRGGDCEAVASPRGDRGEPSPGERGRRRAPGALPGAPLGDDLTGGLRPQRLAGAGMASRTPGARADHRRGARTARAAAGPVDAARHHGLVVRSHRHRRTGPEDGRPAGRGADRDHAADAGGRDMSAQAAPRSFEQTRDPAPGTGWQRLSARIIWVDLVISVLSSLPAVIAIWAFDLDD